MEAVEATKRCSHVLNKNIDKGIFESDFESDYLVVYRLGILLFFNLQKGKFKVITTTKIFG